VGALSFAVEGAGQSFQGGFVMVQKSGVWARIALVAAGCLATSVALAGRRANGNVIIFTFDAEGSVAGARYSSNSNESIGCIVTSGTVVGSLGARCWAEDSTGRGLDCVTNDPDIIATARSINPTSYVSFSIPQKPNNGGAQCTRLAVTQSSEYLH
jgi:hypothetical protein